MIIKSSKKKEINIDINLTNKDGEVCPLQRTDHIKYLGVMIDNTLSWKHHISYMYQVSALPLLNLLNILTVKNVFYLHVSKFTHLWHKKKLPLSIQNYFCYASNVHSYDTRYASKQNLYKSSVRTNTGKQTLSYIASEYWKELSNSIKEQTVSSFSKTIKQFLLVKQFKVTVDLRGVFWGKQYSALCINGKYINLYIIGLESLYNWLHVCVKICLV